jgi:hypothetical protein
MAAGMFLLLDLICFKSSKSVDQVASQLETIHLSISMLQDASTSRIDASAVVKRLLHLYNIGFESQAVDRQTLLTIMRHASIPVIKSTAPINIRSLQSGGSLQPGSLAQQVDRRVNLLQNSA